MAQGEGCGSAKERRRARRLEGKLDLISREEEEWRSGLDLGRGGDAEEPRLDRAKEEVGGFDPRERRRRIARYELGGEDRATRSKGGRDLAMAKRKGADLGGDGLEREQRLRFEVNSFFSCFSPSSVVLFGVLLLDSSSSFFFCSLWIRPRVRKGKGDDGEDEDGADGGWMWLRWRWRCGDEDGVEGGDDGGDDGCKGRPGGLRCCLRWRLRGDDGELVVMMARGGGSHVFSLVKKGRGRRWEDVSAGAKGDSWWLLLGLVREAEAGSGDEGDDRSGDAVCV